MKRFIAVVAAVGLCAAYGLGCKKMTSMGTTPEETPEAAAPTMTPPPPPPPAAPAEPTEPEQPAE